MLAATPLAATPSVTPAATPFSRHPLAGEGGGWNAERGAVAARLACWKERARERERLANRTKHRDA